MEEIDFNEVLYSFWKKKWQIISITLIACVLGFIYGKFMIKPMYESTTSLVLSKSSVDSTGSNKQSSAITQNDVILNQKLVTTYSEIIKSRSLAKEVINQLNLNIDETEFINAVKVSSKEDTELLQITVTNASPEQAAQIANLLADVFTDKVKEVYNIDNVSIIDQAEVNPVPVNKSTVKTVAIFGIAGLLMICFYLFLRVFFNTTVKNQEEVEKITGLPVIAIIPKHE